MDKVSRLDAEVAYKLASVPVMDVLPILERYRSEIASEIVEACAKTAYDWCKVHGSNPVDLYSTIRRVHTQVA